MTKKLELYVNSSGDYSITDHKGNVYSPEEAKELEQAGKVTNCNMAFEQLVRHEYDVAALKAYYAKLNASRRA